MLSVETYVEELRNGKLSQAEPLRAATVRAVNSAIISRCMKMYKEQIQKLYGDPKKPARFKAFHVADKVISEFDKANKMGGDRAMKASLNELRKRIAESKENSSLINQAAWDQKQIHFRFEATKQEHDRFRRELSETEKQQEDFAKERETKKNKAEETKEPSIESVLGDAVHVVVDFICTIFKGPDPIRELRRVGYSGIGIHYFRHREE